MLDLGGDFDPETLALKTAMSSVKPLEWSSAQRKRARRGMEPGTGGVKVKQHFGSDFPYRELTDPGVAYAITGGLGASSCVGGFSKVWGAAALPYRSQDMSGWPIGQSDLAGDYQAVLQFAGLSAEADDLAAELPLFTDQPERLIGSSQAEALLTRWTRHRQKLLQGGIRFGRSRLMVRGGPPPAGCRACGHCLYGCPYDKIFDAAQQLGRLEQSGRFAYRGGYKVKLVREERNRATVEAIRLVDGGAADFIGDRVFLAAGVISSTEIVLRSLSRYGEELSIADSQYYVVPMLGPRSARSPREEGLHTLAQLFLEIDQPDLSPYLVHLQIYTYNEMISRFLAHSIGRLGKLGDWLAAQAERRTYFLQGYLHSHHSASLTLCLERRSDGTERLRVRPRPNAATAVRVRSVMRHLLRHAPRLGLVPAFPLLHVTEPGRGFHSGGTMPMSKDEGTAANRDKIATDLLGRPAGWRRIHVADASTFPSIPATTITLTAMANAYRIGRLAAEASL